MAGKIRRTKEEGGRRNKGKTILSSSSILPYSSFLFYKAFKGASDARLWFGRLTIPSFVEGD